MIKVKCQQCGSEYEVRPYRQNKTRFCSLQCGAKNSFAKNRPDNRARMIGNTYRKGLKSTNPFPKGHTPWNRGVKGIRLSPQSEFKKGQKSLRWLPVGTVKIRPDRGGNVRAFVKVAEPAKWRMRAVLNWEAVNGPVPIGSVIHHKDRDTTNDALENLQCLTRAQHIQEHRKEFKKQAALL